jgi:hypothetical protein
MMNSVFKCKQSEQSLLRLKARLPALFQVLPRPLYLFFSIVILWYSPIRGIAPALLNPIHEDFTSASFVRHDFNHVQFSDLICDF